MTNNNISLAGSEPATYISATELGGTIYFEPILPEGDSNAPGQIWILGDDINNTTITCQFPGGNLLYLASSDANEGSYIGADLTLNSYSNWKIEADGSIQLINDGTTRLYAVIAENGLLSLSSTPKSKWKYTKVTSKGGTR